jgi:hypothetical protein
LGKRATSTKLKTAVDRQDYVFKSRRSTSNITSTEQAEMFEVLASTKVLLLDSGDGTEETKNNSSLEKFLHDIAMSNLVEKFSLLSTKEENKKEE